MADTQTWDASEYKRHAGFVAQLGTPLIDLLGLPRGARVLDLGCGDGVLTEQLAARGFDVLGLDASEAMVRAARERGLAAEVCDGHELTLVEAFDGVFSNATLHWLTRPDDVIAGVRRALRPRGVFAGEFGGAGNVAAVVQALTTGLDARGIDGRAAMPWYFPSPGEYASRLERGGFRVEFIAHFDRPTPLPTDVLGWIGTFGESFTRRLPESERGAYLEEVRSRLAEQLIDDAGRWVLDYVRLRFRATKLAA